MKIAPSTSTPVGSPDTSDRGTYSAAEGRAESVRSKHLPGGASAVGAGRLLDALFLGWVAAALALTLLAIAACNRIAEIAGGLLQ